RADRPRLCRSGGLAVEPESVRLVAVRAGRADMLRVDLRAVLDDVDQRHGVAATEAVFLLQPVDDDTRLGVGAIEPLFFGALDELARGEPGLVLDVVEVRLERHGRSSIGAVSRQIMLNYVNGPGPV